METAYYYFERLMVNLAEFATLAFYIAIMLGVVSLVASL